MINPITTEKQFVADGVRYTMRRIPSQINNKTDCTPLWYLSRKSVGQLNSEVWTAHGWRNDADALMIKHSVSLDRIEEIIATVQ